MSGQHTLLEDTRYKGFVQRYAFDLTRFAIEVVGMIPTPDQVKLFNSVCRVGSRTCVRSGHGTGKSRAVAVISLWHLLCYYNSNTLLTAPKIEQVKNIAWKEMVDMGDKIRQGYLSWIVAYFEIKAERIYVTGYKEGWFITAKTAPRGAPENLAGMHRDWYLIIADEASGIPDANFSVLTGALTDKRNRMLIVSQPTRSSGFFYNTHNKLSSTEGGAWYSIRMNSEKSPLVSKEFILEKRVEYTEEEYTIKVLGEFPEKLDGYLLGRKVAEACIDRDVIGDRKFGYVLSCDVGAGEYRDKSVAILAKVYGYGDYGDDARRVQVIDVPIYSNTKNLQDFAGAVFNIATELENITVLVDAGGMGIGVCQHLETLGLTEVKRIKWGAPCFKKANKDRFFNQRAQAMAVASRAAKENRLGIKGGLWRRELLDQMSRTPYHYDDKARYVIARKEDMRKVGIPSPDLWDAISFCFLEGVDFMISESKRNISANNKIMDALNLAESLFKDVW